jgi:hypothetical protein
VPAPEFTPQGGRSPDLPAPHDSAPHGPGEAAAPAGPPPKPPPHDGAPQEPGDGSTAHDGPSDGSYDPTAIGALSSDDVLALADYTGFGYEDLNTALRSDGLDASQHARVEALNDALQKLPAYQGPVVRGTNLPPEVLAQYQPGEVITECGFLSTTSNRAVAESPAFAGNVEFRILSTTGREISPFSILPAEQEVLFPAGVKFYIVSKTVDPLTGRTIIEMIER